MLPFLKKDKWPKLAKPMDTSHYGYSEEDMAVEELIQAIESNNHSALMEALQALIEIIGNKHAELHEET